MSKGKAAGAFIERVATALGVDAKKEVANVTKLIQEQKWTEKNFGSKIGKYKADQAKRIGVINAPASQKRIANLPDPNPSSEIRKLQQEGIKERNLINDYTGAEYNGLADSIRDDARYNKVSAPGVYAKEYEAQAAQQAEADFSKAFQNAVSNDSQGAIQSLEAELYENEPQRLENYLRERAPFEGSRTQAAQQAEAYEDSLIQNIKTKASPDKPFTLSFDENTDGINFGTVGGGFAPIPNTDYNKMYGLYSPAIGGVKAGDYTIGAAPRMLSQAEVNKAMNNLSAPGHSETKGVRFGIKEEKTDDVSGKVTKITYDNNPKKPILISNNKYNIVPRQKNNLSSNNPKTADTGTEANASFGSVGRAALGTAVGGAALMAALSGSRGQQNNAQLYGQQPLY